MFEKTEGAIWSGRPSVRTSLPLLAIAVMASWCLFGRSGTATQVIVDSTHLFLPWTEDLVARVGLALKLLSFVPVAFVLIGMVTTLSEHYEVTTDRFLLHRGILVRSHDVIVLHRMRDYRVRRPLLRRLLGTGMIFIVSRDTTLPEVEIGPFTDAREIQDIIRKQVIAHQEATGYREWEAIEPEAPFVRASFRARITAIVTQGSSCRQAFYHTSGVRL